MAGMLDGKATIVTGASGGIGAEAARVFAREGARLLLVDIAPETGEAVAREITAGGGEAAFMKVDTTDEAQIEAMVKRAVDLYGRLDCAFNNVGVGNVSAFVTELTRAEFERVLGINVIGTWMCIKHEIPRMLEGGGGAIVNTSSMSGVFGNPGMAFYAASKHAVQGLTKSTSAEFGRQNIRVNALCPGAVMTPRMKEVFASTGRDPSAVVQTALNRGAETSEVADLAAFLLSSRSSYITGQAIHLDGGRSASSFFPQ